MHDSTVVVLILFKNAIANEGDTDNNAPKIYPELLDLFNMTPCLDCSQQKRGPARTTASREKAKLPFSRFEIVTHVANHCHFMKVAARNCAMQSNDFA